MGLEEVGRLIKAAEGKGPARFVTGVTTAAPSAGRIKVDVGNRVVPATIPGSFRSNLTSGQNVRLCVQGMLYTVDSVLSPLDAPAVTVLEGSPNTSPGVNGSTSVGSYDYVITDNDWTSVRSYTRDISYQTVVLAANINELRDDVGANADDIATLQWYIQNLLVTVEELRTALAAQGNIS